MEGEGEVAVDHLDLALIILEDLVHDLARCAAVGALVLGKLNDGDRCVLGTQEGIVVGADLDPRQVGKGQGDGAAGGVLELSDVRLGDLGLLAANVLVPSKRAL